MQIEVKNLKVYFQKLRRMVKEQQGFWLRCFLVWAIGCLAISTDEKSSYDHRFNLRGNQKVSKQIVIILISEPEFANFSNRPNVSSMHTFLDPIQDLSELSENHFWDRRFWTQVLAKILSQKPKSVGVTSYFPEVTTEYKRNLFSPIENSIFQRPEIFWGSPSYHLDRLDRIIRKTISQKLNIPAHSTSSPDYFETNSESIDLPRDQDGYVRRIFSQTNDSEHLTERLTGLHFPDNPGGELINFRGDPMIFETYNLAQIFSMNFPKDAFLNKIVLIGTEGTSQSLFLTPIGPMHKVFIMAQLVDNLLANRWIKRWHFAWYSLLMFFWMILSVFIITRYPQSVALYFFIWVATLMAALSAWVFDTFNIWLPAFSPFVILGTTWIVFIGYQASKMEKLHHLLKNEQKVHYELEQLKNNFVSLISHDLKTPIAKIQAIVERLIGTQKNVDLQQDLLSLRQSGEELNKYIRSILKVLRVEARDFKLNTEAVDINEIIERVLQQIKPLAQEKQIKIIKELEPMFSMDLDSTLISEVILNLIENALKYSNSGSAVHIKSEEKDNVVHVQVRDEGEGIPTEELETVWNKFTRGKDQDFKSKGTGLGLYLVKFFIELHGGRVHLESELGRGTSVHFYLPLGVIDK